MVYNASRMTDRTHKRKIITPIGTSFIGAVVPPLMLEAFGAYKKRNFTESYFQLNQWENSHAAAAIVLTAAATEAYRNRLYYLEKGELSGINDVSSDISKMFMNKWLRFPTQRFKSIMEEVFVIRDIIMHGHMYELDVVLSEKDWRMIGYEQRKITQYKDKKFERSVNIQAEETKSMRFNVQPLRIGFEDLFKVLLVFDLFAGMAEKAFGRGYVSSMQQIDNHWTENLSQFLTHYYNQVPNQQFVEWVERLSKGLRKDFASFLPDGGEYFITNTCPKCSTLGFRKLEGIWHCNACGVEMGFKLDDIKSGKPPNQDHE